MIWIGCSGWHYPDWGGTFYPRGSSGDLKIYSSFFNTVEVNVTFYRDVGLRTIQSWIKTVGTARNFRFSIKAPMEISHKLLTQDTPKAMEAMKEFGRNHLLPIREAGYAGHVLVQLPPWFTSEDLPKLYEFLGDGNFFGTRVAVEFRDISLLKSARARSNIEDLGHIVAEIDSPDGTFIHPDSGSGNRYFRFHGRNKRGWEGNSSNPSDRYNYYYGKDELHILARYVKESIERGDEIFVYFNNHPYGNAPRNAIEFSEILGLGRPGNQKQLI